MLPVSVPTGTDSTQNRVQRFFLSAGTQINHIHCLPYLALTRGDSLDTTRKSTVQARPGPASIVSVPGTTQL
jgi:hypothetical protein